MKFQETEQPFGTAELGSDVHNAPQLDGLIKPTVSTAAARELRIRRPEAEEIGRDTDRAPRPHPLAGVQIETRCDRSGPMERDRGAVSRTEPGNRGSDRSRRARVRSCAETCQLFANWAAC